MAVPSNWGLGYMRAAGAVKLQDQEYGTVVLAILETPTVLSLLNLLRRFGCALFELSRLQEGAALHGTKRVLGVT